MNKYRQWMERFGVFASGRVKGQATERVTRFDYDQGPMYFLGQQIVKGMEDSGFPAKIWQCYRPPDEQNEYYDAGTSKQKAWHSPHQFFEAVDILHPTLFWEAGDEYFDQLAAVVRIVAEKFGVDLEHGHHWSWVDSAHVELKDWRMFREVIRTRWRDEMAEWQAERREDPLSEAVMPVANPPDSAELAARFKRVLPKEWRQHVSENPLAVLREFQTARQRGDPPVL